MSDSSEVVGLCQFGGCEGDDSKAQNRCDVCCIKLCEECTVLMPTMEGLTCPIHSCFCDMCGKTTGTFDFVFNEDGDGCGRCVACQKEFENARARDTGYISEYDAEYMPASRIASLRRLVSMFRKSGPIAKEKRVLRAGVLERRRTLGETRFINPRRRRKAAKTARAFRWPQKKPDTSEDSD